MNSDIAGFIHQVAAVISLRVCLETGKSKSKFCVVEVWAFIL